MTEPNATDLLYERIVMLERAYNEERDRADRLDALRAVDWNDLREALAAYSHDSAWSGWMRYMFGKGTMNADGTWTMPAALVERWTRQMDTLYINLTEGEKQSDRKEADEMLLFVRAALG